VDQTEIVNIIMNFAPILVIIGVLAGVAHSVMSFGSYGGSSTTTEGPIEDDDINTYDAEKRMRLEIERMLMEQMAKGEITEEEYTSRMARL
jgi:uncharacterized membrane protein